MSLTHSFANDCMMLAEDGKECSIIHCWDNVFQQLAELREASAADVAGDTDVGLTMASFVRRQLAGEDTVILPCSLYQMALRLLQKKQDIPVQ